MKIIKVENCGECYYCRLGNTSQKHDNYIGGLFCKGKRILHDFPNIPSWCPLEDEKDLIPALDLLQRHLEQGCYIAGQEGEIWLYKPDGDGIMGANTIQAFLLHWVERRNKDED